MNYSELLEKINAILGYKTNQSDMARALGIDRRLMSYRVKNNTTVKVSDFDKLEEYFKLKDLVSLLSEEKEELITIEHIHISPSCGTGTTVLALPEVTPIKLGRKMIETVLKVSDPNNLKVFTACGDSMEDTIDDGNLLLVDTGRTDFNNGGIFIITINNEWFVKRLRKRINGQLDIISDNQAKYPIESYMPEDNIEIVVKGRVIKNLSKGL